MAQPVPDSLRFMLDLPPGYMTVSHLVAPSGSAEMTFLIREPVFRPPSRILLLPYVVVVGDRVGVLFFSLKVDGEYYAVPFDFHGDFGPERTGRSMLEDLDRQERIVVHFVTDKGLEAVSFPYPPGRMADPIRTLEGLDAWTQEEFQQAVEQVHRSYPSARDLMREAMRATRHEESLN